MLPERPGESPPLPSVDPGTTYQRYVHMPKLAHFVSTSTPPVRSLTVYMYNYAKTQNTVSNQKLVVGTRLGKMKKCDRYQLKVLFMMITMVQYQELHISFECMDTTCLSLDNGIYGVSQPSAMLGTYVSWVMNEI